MNQLYELKSEGTLWDDFVNGEKESLNCIYHKYAQALYNYGCHFTSDHHLVRDCIQDVFIDLQEYRNGLTKSNSNIRLYLFKALKHKIVNSLIKLKNFRETDSNHSLTFCEPIEDILINHETEMQVKTWLSHAFSSLTFRQKEALYLRFISNLGYREIGQVLHLNYQSTRNLVFRGLEKLRQWHSRVLFFFFSVAQLLMEMDELFDFTDEIQ